MSYNIPVNNITPSNNQVLTYLTVDGYWAPKDTGLTPLGSANTVLTSTGSALAYTQSLSLGTGSISFGTNSSSTANIRLNYDASDRTIIAMRDSGNTTDWDILQSNGSNTRVISETGQIKLNGFNGSLIEVAPLIIGTGNIATIGTIRLENTHSIVGRNAANNANITMLAISASNEVFLGGDTSFGTQANTIRIYSSSQTLIGIGSTNYMAFTGSRISCNQTFGGLSSSFRWGRTAKQITSDANYTAAASEYENPIFEVTSSVTLTATRDIILPLTNGAMYWVFNGTTGVQSLRFIGATGTGVTVANGARATIYCDGTNFVRVTADTLI